MILSIYLSLYLSIHLTIFLSPIKPSIYLFVCSPLLIFLTLSMPSHIQYFPKKKPDGQNIKSQNFLLFQVSYHHHHWCIKTIYQFWDWETGVFFGKPAVASAVYIWGPAGVGWGPPGCLGRIEPPEPAIRMADIHRISVTSRMGSVNFANHIIRENNCILWWLSHK